MKHWRSKLGAFLSRFRPRSRIKLTVLVALISLLFSLFSLLFSIFTWYHSVLYIDHSLVALFTNVQFPERPLNLDEIRARTYHHYGTISGTLILSNDGNRHMAVAELMLRIKTRNPGEAFVSCAGRIFFVQSARKFCGDHSKTRGNIGNTGKISI